MKIRVGTSTEENIGRKALERVLRNKDTQIQKKQKFQSGGQLFSIRAFLFL